ncbi:alpha/beta fold hydrolase [Roseomonas elaeocarpi]|uniref:Alpha/beta fold hydrolase n=1 Tax=Roseomonas elaeocarpi TaxID=907779 RepID=A0ABV6JYN0_9PROT
MRLRDVSAADGLRLRLRDWPGDPGRTPLLCLAGIGRNSLDYTGLAERHAGTRRIIAPDYAGHGESDRAPEPERYTPDHAISDLLDCCASLGIDRCVVVGTSFGGLLGMFLAVARPALVRGVVLNDIGPQIEMQGLMEAQGLLSDDPAFLDLATAADYLRRLMPGVPLEGEARWQDFAERTYRLGEDGRWHPRWDTRLGQVASSGTPMTSFDPVFEALADLPTLLVWGEQSHILSAGTVAAMRRSKPDLEVLVVPEAGHAPTLEEDSVIPRLDAFLNRLA